VKSLEEAIRKNGVYMCIECGKCSAVCPVTASEKEIFTSPRLLAETAISSSLSAMLDMPLFWSCLTCRRCSDLCPSAVLFSEFVRDVRGLAETEGRSGPSTHGGVITSWMRIMTDPSLSQHRLGWLREDLHVSTTSDTVFFVGCLPHYDELFKDSGFEGMEIARSAIRILNHMGIRPQVSAQERCCGHDRLWQGDFETFKRLGALNLEMLEKTGARRVVTACPECALTLAVDYPGYIGAHGMEVFHISQVVAAGLSAGRWNLAAFGAARRVTYHDPCRLGRHLGEYDAPRSLIDGLGFDLVEMAHYGSRSVCCGTSCWTACGQANKRIQSARLDEARSTGAELLVTACLKCQIHFLCARKGYMPQKESLMPIRDITTLVAEGLPANGQSMG
jgi:heterodisulfide reductase subunit D